MELMGQVPVVCACMGSVAGLGAVRVTISHFSLMIEETSQLFVAGPGRRKGLRQARRKKRTWRLSNSCPFERRS